MWYLYALIFWHLTLPLLTHLRDKGLPFALLGLAGAVALGLWAGNVDWPFTLVRAFAYYPFYAFGVLFRPQIDRLDDLAATSPVMRLAPAGALEADNVKAFYIPCGLGISLKPSVWHAVPFAVGKEVMSVCIFRNNTSHDDIYFDSLQEELGLML